MNEALKRILDDAVQRITDSEKKARDAAAQAKKDLQAVADFAESLPHRILDTMSVFGVTEFNWDDKRPWQPGYGYAELHIGCQAQKLGGGFNTPLTGKYRAIVILQRME